MPTFLLCGGLAQEGNSPYSLAMQHDKLRTFIEQNMSGCTIPESAKKAVAAQKEAAAQKAKPAPVEPMAMDEGAESTTAKKNEVRIDFIPSWIDPLFSAMYSVRVTRMV